MLRVKGLGLSGAEFGWDENNYHRNCPGTNDIPLVYLFGWLQVKVLRLDLKPRMRNETRPGPYNTMAYYRLHRTTFALYCTAIRGIE